MQKMSESEKKISKLKRRFSKKPAHSKSNAIPEDVPTGSGKSATLPEGMSLHQPHSSEGLLTKLKRRFHFGSKGKYDFKSFINSPSKPQWMRRKSDDTQLRHAESPAELAPGADNVVTKAQSAKTQRKAKSDKEDVILIRKDKRVSVLCKAENGEKHEVIFTNEDVSDEDSSGAWGRMEEDPYATISSVKEFAPIINSESTENSVASFSPSVSPEPMSMNAQSAPLLLDDHYPYAKINPDRKSKSPDCQQVYPQATLFNSKAAAYRRSRKEPDYETLDEVKEHRKTMNGFTEPMLVESIPVEDGCPEMTSALDPDYETLEEVKQRCADTFQKPLSVSSASPVTSPALSCTDQEICVSDPKNKFDLPTKGVNCTDHKHTNGSLKLPAQQTSQAIVNDSFTQHDKHSEHEIEECMYDNPNVIIRKYKNEAALNPRRGQTMYEPPLIKTPAEEELVEKLSSLLAPPLPLRNYQKDEVKGEKSRNDGCSARHSWASQTSRALDFIDNHYLRDCKRISPFSSNHDMESSRNNTLKSGTKRVELNDLKWSSKPSSKSPSPIADGRSSVEPVVEDPSPVIQKQVEITLSHQTLPAKPQEIIKPLTAHTDEASHTDVASLTDAASQSDYCVNLAKKIVKEACERAVKEVNEQPESNHEVDTMHTLNGHACISEVSYLSNAGIKQNGLTSHDNALNEITDKLVGRNKSINISSVTFSHEVVKQDGDSEDINLHTSEPDTNSVVCPPEDKSSGQSYNGVNEEKAVDKIEIYKLQGARPKFKPLLLPSQTLFLKEGRTCAGVTKEAVESNGTRDERRNLKEQLSDDSHTWDEAMSPSFSDMNFHEAITESFQLEPSKNVSLPHILAQVVPDSGKDLQVHETVYLDSDSETEDGLSVHKSRVVHVQRDLSVIKVAKPILYVNPRLLENVISGPFTSSQSFDVNYFVNGIFKWGRYFHDFIEDREAVEAKLKSFFHFLRHMLLSESEWCSKNLRMIKEHQEDFDVMQGKIDRRLNSIQDLPTFQDVRIQLLKTEELDNWVPEFSHCLTKQKKLCVVKDEREVSRERVRKPGVEVIRDDLHSDECMVDGVDGTCPLGCMHSPCLSPTKPQDMLADLLCLSSGTLTCSSCGKEEESDSEDEMITLETYAKTVSCTSSKMFPTRVNYDKNAGYCRALYGELAYTAKMRKPRSLTKSILVPVCSTNYCLGAENHISWNNWCTMDAIFKKLVPHISPRLDFQFLLKTYSEFKYFILKDRNRNLDLRGCFTKKYLPEEERCCRFEEFVFLKLLRDELRYFAFVLLRSKSSEALFLEEWDIGFSLLSLLKIVLRNIHKMKNSFSREKVVGQGEGDDFQSFPGVKRWKHFRHSAFNRWISAPLSDAEVSSEEKVFHIENMSNFHCHALSRTLKDWMSPQEYMQDPNVLVSCRTVFDHPDVRSSELTSMRGAEDPKPLHEREDFLESMEQLQLQPWYWGPISYEQAALILKDKEDGSFLVRDSSDQKYLLSLSFKSLGEVHHTRIEHAKGLFSFWSQPESHGKARICEFIEKSIQNSKDGRFLYFLRPSARGTPPLPIRLLSPVSRNFRVATLKHLSRFVVRQTVRNDHLDRLPVPEKVKRYLRNKQYYVEILDEDQWAFDGDYVKS
uniref:SH2 domain-containing protein n=1 Tax=Biomphalaria glabrata TaxID=6526 RepID=A0A2C9JEZ5_BIOGL